MEKFSYSKLDTFCQCKFKYKLHYVDKLHKSSSSIASEFGTLVHETEEQIANSIKDNKNINYIALKNNFIIGFNKLWLKYPIDFLAPDKSGKNYLEKSYFYLKTGIYRLESFLVAHPTYQIVAAELPFEFIYKDKYLFNGFIDRLLYDTQTHKYIIQDIKTYSVPMEKSKLKTPLQFYFYSLAVQKKFNVSSADLIYQYDLPLCDLIQTAGEDINFISNGEVTVKTTLTEIENKNFKPSPTALCHWCEYCITNPTAPEETKYLCPYFCKWTKETKDMSRQYKWEGIENHEKILEAYQQLLIKLE